MINNITTYIVTLGKVGFIKPAPGTWGTLVSLPVAYFFASKFSPSSLILLSAFTFVIGWYFINIYEKNNNTHDASEVVIDEMAGVFITLSVAPVDIKYYILGFILFRFFDILKPYPIYKVDALKTPFSVMFDDVIAGIYGMIVLWVVIVCAII